MTDSALLQQRLQRIRIAHRRADFDATQSLERCLGHVVISSRPEPRSWRQVIEPWQGDIAGPMIPAIEHMAGLRHDYRGPRRFFVVMPRGHDKTGLTGRLCTWAIAYAKHRIQAVAAGGDRDQAALILESIDEERELNPWLAQRLKVNNYTVRGRRGKLQILSSDAGSSSGLKTDLTVLDEITFWRSRELFDVLWSGQAKRPASVFIIITNAGIRGSWQHDILKSALTDPAWHVYEAPTDTKLASWMTEADWEGLRRLLPSGHARRVLDNHWTDTSDIPLLTFPMIQACEEDGVLWEDGVCPPFTRPELYIGVDIGRTKDRSVIWTAERVGDVAVTREIKVMDKTPFAEQKHEIKKRITKNVVAVRIDKGSIGSQLTEELEHDFPRIVEGVQLTAAKQGQLALAVKTAFERHRIRVPVGDIELQADLQLVEEVETSKGGVPTVRTNRGPTGHADRFWAGALMLYGIGPDQLRKRSGVGIKSVRQAQ